MPRIDLVVASCVAAGVLLASCAEVPGARSGSGLEAPATVVQFSYDKVEPATVHIRADARVAWENIAQDTNGYVVLPASIAASFRCSDLGPAFSRTSNDYRSVPIAGMQGDQVSLPCALAPGRYDYEILLVGTGFGDEAPMRPTVLRATIVVE